MSLCLSVFFLREGLPKRGKVPYIYVEYPELTLYHPGGDNDPSIEGPKSPNKKSNDLEFHFAPNFDAISPGAIGDRSFTANFDEVEEEPVSFRTRMSEYNPLSYQGKSIRCRIFHYF